MRSDRELVEASVHHSGGGYLNPAYLLPRIGRKVLTPEDIAHVALPPPSIAEDRELDDSYFIASFHAHLRTLVRPGERLLALYEVAGHLVAPLIESIERFAEFEFRAQEGSIKRKGYFTATESDVQGRLSL